MREFLRSRVTITTWQLLLLYFAMALLLWAPYFGGLVEDVVRLVAIGAGAWGVFAQKDSMRVEQGR